MISEQVASLFTNQGKVLLKPINLIINISNGVNCMAYSRSKYITIGAVVYLVIFFAFASGLVNSIIEGSKARAIVVPSRSVQSIGETIVTVMILFMGMVGIYLLSQVGKAASMRNQWVFVTSGFVTVAIALVLGYNLVQLKS
jgi:hypothetical protein